MTDTKIVEKIKKLLTLANNEGATEGERDNALRMASSLMAKHNLDEASVCDMSDPRTILEYKALGHPWIRQTLNSVGKMFFCNMFYTKTRSGTFTFSFVGKGSNVVTAQLMGDYVIRSIRKEASKKKKELGKDASWELNFCKGSANIIYHRIKEMMAASSSDIATTSTGTELTVASLYKSEEQANDDFLAQREISLRTSKSTQRIGAGFSSGVEFGRSIPLNTQVAAGKSVLKLK